MSKLPIETILPQITKALKQHHGLIVAAPPGSGKTTKVAPALVDAQLCDSKHRTYLLQPRRVAARATAERIAFERDWAVGKEVGYQVRFDSKTSKQTKIIVATEGILLRRITEDPTLEEVGTVILDEFHERSMNADLLLSMLRQVQELVREDLRIIVMSATLDVAPLETYLGVPAIVSDGSLHPVDIKYRPAKPRQGFRDHITESIRETLSRTDGDVLVFLPGVGEINQAYNELEAGAQKHRLELLKLHGSLPLERQQRVLQPSDRRRVILSTNVAETSLTIEGIRTVIDSGQARVLRYDPGVGIDRLMLEPISRSSATQRAGRAGRLTSGTCIRLWDEKSHRARAEFHEPEIRRVDLCGAMLQLHRWGESPDSFPWFEAPHDKSVASAIRLLEQLGALMNGKITDLGSQMASIPTSPRLARMLATADEESRGLAALLAALLSERDPFVRDGGRTIDRAARWDCDVTQRLLALNNYFEGKRTNTPFGTIHRNAAHNIQRVAKQLLLQKDMHWPNELADLVPKLLLKSFPDRLAKRRKPGDAKGLMVGGKGVRLSPQSGVRAGDLFLCIDVDGKSGEAQVRQASRIDIDWLPESLIEERDELFFNPTRKCVEARRRCYWLDLMLSETTASIADESLCAELLFSEAKKDLTKVLPASDSSFHSYLMRLQCLADWAPELELPKCDDDLLEGVLRELCVGKRNFTQLTKGPWLDWLKSQLRPDQQQAIDRECPDRLEVPSGSRIKVEYELGKSPVLAVRIQEIFSWTQTPRIAFGKVPVLLHLLAPNFRPQQVTDDLASFWENTYQIVRKELRRRYPKHSWPEDPLTATPENKGGRRNV